ncbi:MAG: dodecin family protein [Anaerolineae bacterium]|jgi:flavin-binding protein dodecin
MAVSKVIDLIGSSTVGWEDAARNALAGAFKSLHGISDLEIIQYTARVVENEIIEYRALVRLAFVVD